MNKRNAYIVMLAWIFFGAQFARGMEAYNAQGFCIKALSDLEETQGSILTFAMALRGLGPDIHDVIQLDSKGDGNFAVSLAGYAVWNDKKLFLEMILQIAPELLYKQTQECVGGINVNLLSPLSCAVHYRKPELVKYILAHEILIKHKITNKGSYSLLLNDSLTWGKKWYVKNPSIETNEIIKILENI